MKVFLTENSTVNKSTWPNKPLTGLKPGDVIEASILRRLGPSEAVIETRGRVLSARFSGPLPDSRVISLLMTEYKNGTYHFTLNTQTVKGGGFSLLRDILTLPEADLHKLKMVPAEKMKGAN